MWVAPRSIKAQLPCLRAGHLWGVTHTQEFSCRARIQLLSEGLAWNHPLAWLPPHLCPAFPTSFLALLESKFLLNHLHTNPQLMDLLLGNSLSLKNLKALKTKAKKCTSLRPGFLPCNSTSSTCLHYLPIPQTKKYPNLFFGEGKNTVKKSNEFINK